MTPFIPAGGDVDRAGQHAFADERDRDLGLDTTAVHPVAERIRAAFDAADIADRIDQNWITPAPFDDDYYCLAY